LLTDLKQSSPQVLRESQAIVERAAAVDTGALEGLYETDRGFTFTIAREAALWEVTVQREKGEKVLGYIKAQLEAYEYILDIATKQTPLTEKAIRELHEVMCRNQDTYMVYTTLGPQERKLSKGQYKVDPNHVLGRDGNYHAYAPIEGTPMEMRRLVLELQSEEFQKAHPVLQASYAHYAFVLIHPFADGNGRVARALASIYTYRDQSVPLLILSEKREEYLNALADADVGNYQPFVSFILERTLNSIELFSESIEAALQGSVTDSLDRFRILSRTKNGFTHEDMNNAARILTDSLHKTFQQYVQNRFSKSNEVRCGVTLLSGNTYALSENYRHPSYPQMIQISLTTKLLLSNVGVEEFYNVAVPKNSEIDDDLLVFEANSLSKVVFTVRPSELIPQISGVVQMRLSIFVEKVVQKLLVQLEQFARQSLGRT
jgi:Fic family protein